MGAKVPSGKNRLSPEAVAKLIRHSPTGLKKTLYFNYRQPRSTPWNQAKLQNDHDYECVFPRRKGDRA